VELEDWGLNDLWSCRLDLLAQHIPSGGKDAPFNSDGKIGVDMSNTTGQQILAVLESDFLTAAGQPLLNFLQAVEKNPNPLALGAAWLQLTGELIGAAPTLEAQIATQIAAALQTKVTGLIAAAQAASQQPK
jgi:hypothetical protein